MKQRSRRALSLALTLCMILGFFPAGIGVTARADDAAYAAADDTAYAVTAEDSAPPLVVEETSVPSGTVVSPDAEEQIQQQLDALHQEMEQELQMELEPLRQQMEREIQMELETMDEEERAEWEQYIRQRLEERFADREQELRQQKEQEYADREQDVRQRVEARYADREQELRQQMEQASGAPDTPEEPPQSAGVEYLDANGKPRTAESVTAVTTGDTTWNVGWYVVNSVLAIESRVTVSGDVCLILADNAELTVNGGINVANGNSLTIYAQSTGDAMGVLSATGGESQAGIGGGYGAGGTITINGGVVTATGGDAGIGGADNSISLSWTDKDNDSITASSYGGTVTFAKDFAIENTDAALTPETISSANGLKIVPLQEAHVHNWTYTADGATITETCANRDCPVTEGLTLTISAPENLAYDGTPKEVTLNSDYNPEAFPDYVLTYTPDPPVELGVCVATVTVGGITASLSYAILPGVDDPRPDEPSTPDEPTTPDEPSTPVIYTVSFNLNGHGSNAPANQQVEEGQYASIPSAPANEDGFTFDGWTDAPENGEIFQFNATPVTSNRTLYAFWIENVPEVTEEDVSEKEPAVGETAVDMSGVSAITKPEDMETLQEAAQSVQMPEAESAEEQAVQNAAMQDAVEGIDEATKQQENQSAMAALIAAGLVRQNEDGSVPESTEIEVTREVYMEVQAKALVEQIVEGVVRKLLSMDINPFYNVLANVAGSETQAVSVSGGNPTTINKPLDLSVGLPDDFIPANRNFAYVNHQHNGVNYTYRAPLGPVVDGTRTMSFRAMGLSPFEIMTDTMGATITEDVGGVSMELSYATLLEAVDAVENNGTITIVEPVTANIASSSKTYTLALGKDVTGADVSADDVTLTVDGKAVTFKDGRAVILAASESVDNNPVGDTPSDTDTTTSGGCYVATSVYGSYDCPEVWTLRRFRDEVLAETWYGRLFIRLYYTVSPTAVKWFGNYEWFQNFFRDRLDKMVSGLQADGFESTLYQDLEW